MKVNEVPEKVYIEPSLDSIWGMAERSCESEVEYTRTDAFIEKACEWLENHNDYQRVHDNGRGVRFDMTLCVIDFRKAMKGE
jgi:hypothetical protein